MTVKCAVKLCPFAQPGNLLLSRRLNLAHALAKLGRNGLQAEGAEDILLRLAYDKRPALLGAAIRRCRAGRVGSCFTEITYICTSFPLFRRGELEKPPL